MSFGRLFSVVLFGVFTVLGWGVVGLGMLVFLLDPADWDGGDTGTLAFGFVVAVVATVVFVVLLQKRRKAKKEAVQFFPPQQYPG